MNKQILINVLLVLSALALSLLVFPATPASYTFYSPYPPPGTASPTLPPYPPPQTPVSPLPTPSPLPSPPPTPTATPGPSAEAHKALAFIAQREGVPVERLILVNEFRREAALLGRTFQAVTGLDLESGHFYQVLVDLNSGQVEEYAAVAEAEAQHYRAKYGKLQPALYERLQTMRDEEMVRVTIWVVAPPGQSLAERQAAIFAELAATQAAIEQGGKPMDVSDPALAERIYQEYVQRLNAETAARIRPLVEALEVQGFAVETSPGLPAVMATLPKRTIQTLVEREDVGAIYLSEGGQRRLLLNSAVPTNLAPTVWARGYDGTGVDIAILEDDNVDFTSPSGSECPNGDNCFRHQGPTRNGSGGID